MTKVSHPLFYQCKVPANGRVHTQGVTRGDGVALHPTTVNSPPPGYYYVNERSGVYVFSLVDWRAGVTISYVDIQRSGRGVRKEHVERAKKTLESTAKAADDSQLAGEP